MNAMSPATALCHARVLTPDGVVDGLAVLMQDGRIADLVANDAVPAEAKRVDLGGALLAPGFIDAQVNGGGGTLFNNDTSVEAIRTIAEAHRRFGTTGLLPTLISDDADVMARAIAATRDAIAQQVPGILGIHLEGPYIAPARKGTHDAGKFRVPGADEVAMATSLANGVTLLTLAPEQVPADTIRAMVARGAIVVAGHTAATYEQVRTGIDAGISGFTHLYNAMSPLQGREPGAVGAALEDDGCWCGVIVDGVHVHPASLRVALAAKPRGKVFLVTDAMPPVGADDPSYVLYGETITAIDGVVRNAAGALAGSALDMITAVRNSVHLLGLPLEEALRMASTYPAEFLGLGATHGRIAPGYQADLVALDARLQVVGTWIGGK
ncbi:N-acetylglucosamine-6-phosphate deacetylase [Pseudoxanthomonas sp. PXM03]|uniref:N-acetylglucosamine-6-phosphate deacetylase n=1 Tax=Pseudoxanthomonas sp. PXM03 TaxID=2769284 RepID=UPI001784F53A|nr:N-acetylglucosamine-6-phosphate deacetylase [Pseudoxanthomonas sp. PXM03]MBD9434590.1 N-acetylglucosamine-6-phosphate deacetylase [Pseudoxanthomonas sp. PXM03]